MVVMVMETNICFSTTQNLPNIICKNAFLKKSSLKIKMYVIEIQMKLMNHKIKKFTDVLLHTLQLAVTWDNI